ncbi:hypothetical protein N9948_01960 [bacterium]|nr:hypothetical protein [bacterium]
MSEKEKYFIKLGRRVETINGEPKELWHVVSPELTGRIAREDWQSFIRFLRDDRPSRLNWGLYENQPVYEYRCTPDDLKYSINYFLIDKLKLNFAVLFETFEYDSNFVPGDIPVTHQQHLAL